MFNKLKRIFVSEPQIPEETPETCHNIPVEEANSYNKALKEIGHKRKLKAEWCIHNRLWKGLKQAVDQGLVNLLYTPITVRTPQGNYRSFMIGATSGIVLTCQHDKEGNYKEGHLFRANEELCTKYMHDWNYRIPKYSVSPEKREQFYAMIEKDASPKDIVAFLGEDSKV